MYCYNCGNKVNDGLSVCPVCKAQLPHTAVKQPVIVQQTVNATSPVPEAKKSASAKAKGYAVVVSALLAFPMLICLMIDYLGVPEWMCGFIDIFGFDSSNLQEGNMTWSLYLLGFVMCIWMAAVLPVLKPKYPVITACGCLAVISVYMLLLGYINDGADWYREWVTPIFLMITVSAAIMSVLISYKILKGVHIVTGIGAQVALFFVGLEILIDTNIDGEVNLRMSLLSAVTIIGLLLIYEAVNYAVKVNKK